MPENAFDPIFLDRLREADAPASAREASTAGPWRVVLTPTGQYGYSAQSGCTCAPGTVSTRR